MLFRSSKIQRLNEIKAKEIKLEKIILVFFKSVSHSLFWEEINKSENIASLIDVLWDFERKNVPLEQITHPQILDIYRAKGWIQDTKSCNIFELENMRILKQHSTLCIDFSFEYRCHSCKQVFPFENARCSHCGELLNTDVIYKIQKVDNETRRRGGARLRGRQHQRARGERRPRRDGRHAGLPRRVARGPLGRGAGDRKSVV